MSRVTQNHSQLLFTYGPGAMVDLPDHAVIVSGLEDWAHNDGRLIEERRLMQALATLPDDRKPSGHAPALRTPPFDDPDRPGTYAPGIDVNLFPGWFVCDTPVGSAADGKNTGETRRLMVEFKALDVSAAGKLAYTLNGKKVAVNPIRFVGACKKGHLQDIDWRLVTHRDEAAKCSKCSKPMYWTERGASSDPSDISVRCTCGASVTLAQLYLPKFLGECKGASPWLSGKGRGADIACDEHLKLLPRSATNGYFPQTLTVISLPEPNDALAAAVERHWSAVQSLLDKPYRADALRSTPPSSTDFANYTDEEINAAIDRASSGQGGVTTVADPRIAEFDQLTVDADEIGRDGEGSRLFAQRLDLTTLHVPDRIRPLLTSIVQVDRLREVACIYGFTRLAPAPTVMESELDDLNLQVVGAPLSVEADWLPATERFGEGIFVHLDSELMARWWERPAVIERIEMLAAGEGLDAAHREREAEHLGPAYWAVHTLSHALMAELSLDCGYPLSSLKERIYASKRGEMPRHGILIYTATFGGQGTLGGLSHTAGRVPVLLDRAMEKAELCSNDPVCTEHRPDDAHDERNLHGAACHACLLMPETSCEARNGRLDRTFLRPSSPASLTF